MRLNKSILALGHALIWSDQKILWSLWLDFFGKKHIVERTYPMNSTSKISNHEICLSPILILSYGSP